MKLTLKNSNLLYFLTVVVHAIYLVFRSPEIFFVAGILLKKVQFGGATHCKIVFLIHYYIRQFQQDIYALFVIYKSQQQN